MRKCKKTCKLQTYTFLFAIIHSRFGGSWSQTTMYSSLNGFFFFDICFCQKSSVSFSKAQTSKSSWSFFVPDSDIGPRCSSLQSQLRYWDIEHLGSSQTKTIWRGEGLGGPAHHPDLQAGRESRRRRKQKWRNREVITTWLRRLIWKAMFIRDARLKSGLRILIRAPKCHFWYPPKRPFWVFLAILGVPKRALGVPESKF